VSTTAEAGSSVLVPSSRTPSAVRRPPIVAFYSEKGGVAKTATTTGVAAVAASRGLRVRVVDLDPRATATAECGIVDPEFTVNDILYTDPENPVSAFGLAGDALLPAGEGWSPLVKVLASERALAQREADPAPHMENRLRQSFEGGVLDEVDLVLIDVPPRAGGKIVAAALNLATHVLIPITLDEDGRIGAVDATRSVERHAITSGQDIKVDAVFRSIVEGTVTNLADRIEAWILEAYGDRVLPVRVPKYNVRKVTRFACQPITSAKDPKAAAIMFAYGQLLDYLLTLEVAAR
jgi:cellulose biosynthesis protein BcsQ